MADIYNLGMYNYKGRVNFNLYPKLPAQLKFDSISACGVLLQLMMGKVVICDKQDKVLSNQKINYTKLPFESCGVHSYEQFNEIFGIDVRDEESRNTCNKYMLRDRKNNFVYEHILNELTQYFVVCDKSPCEGFVHLYRMLEFMGYSFPMIYASKSKEYRGSYESLKKFFQGGEGMGELKFLGYFLDTLFEDELTTYDFEFEILFDIDEIDDLRKDFNKAISFDWYTFEGDTLTVKFKNLKDLFVEMRNKYFHMLLGKGNNNFLDMRYDKNELFKSVNPVFVNWISCIFVKIIQHGLSMYD